MTDEPGVVDETNAKKEFSPVRKGYDPAEVDEYLAEYDVAFRELEEYAARLKRELSTARSEIVRLKSNEQESIDKAMAAVFESKDRIIDRAMAKAREIEDKARAAAGLPAITEVERSLAQPEASPAPVLAESLGLSDSGTPDPADSALADDVLQRMLAEAETIRERLDDGLAAAFHQMEQMQHAAEIRATDLLDEARHEAARFRDAAAGAGEKETTIEVNLPLDGSEATRPPRQSRYSRNSAALPRIGNDGGPSVLASMSGLRNKLRESEKDARPVPDASAS